MAKKLLLLLGLALSVVALDQLTKFWVLDALTTAFPPNATASQKVDVYFGKPPPTGFSNFHFGQKRYINVSDKFFRVRYAENPGAAWGLFRELPDKLRGPLFHVICWGAVLLIGYFYFKLSGDPKEKWALYGLPLVLGGALGNYVDRLARGFVIDFLEAHWMDKAYWPSFNVADTAICVGVGMLVLDALVRKDGVTRPAEHPPSATAKSL